LLRREESPPGTAPLTPTGAGERGGVTDDEVTLDGAAPGSAVSLFGSGPYFIARTLERYLDGTSSRLLA